MSDDPYAAHVLIVTGTVPRAEVGDRPLAYYLQNEINRRGGRDPRRRALVVADLWYLQNEVAAGRPVISVGGPGVNALSAAFYRLLPIALAIEDTLLIQMDVALADRRVAVWGMDHDRTKLAVATFAQDRFLGRYLDAVWAAPKT
jgi:hypothetical protein